MTATGDEAPGVVQVGTQAPLTELKWDQTGFQPKRPKTGPPCRKLAVPPLGLSPESRLGVGGAGLTPAAGPAYARPSNPSVGSRPSHPQKVAALEMVEGRTGGGRTGRDESFTTLRSDVICWIRDDLPDHPAIDEYVSQVRLLGSHL